MKKLFGILLTGVLAAGVFTGCGGGNQTIGAAASGSDFKADMDISVISREDGSGTRGAFIELFGIEVKDEDGTKKDTTTKETIIANKTDIMMTNVANDPYAIGYLSLGSLNDTVKALSIDGAKASMENIKNGSYKISRPFHIATKGEATGLAKDFIDFILSTDGQAVVAKSYIAVEENGVPYGGAKPSGKIVVAGSSSVTPIMEKLKEAYEKINPDAVIEIQMSDSTTGMTGAIDGSCDIGMASRDLKDSEKELLTSVEIALDGIVVIVNRSNPASELSSGAVKSIYTGEYLKWNEVLK